MTRAHLVTALLGFALAWCAMPTARSDQLRIALVISNDEYGSQPGPNRCSASATAVRDALRGKGFKIIERDNLDRREFDSAIAALARRIAASPASLAVLYFCGYALEFEGQSFLLPTSAPISTATTMFLPKPFLQRTSWRVWALPHRAGASSCWTYSGRRTARRRDFPRLIEQVISSTFAVIGATNDGTGEGPTAASLALRDQFAEFEMDLDVFVVRMNCQLSRDFSRDGPSCSCHRTEARTSRISVACACNGRSFNRRARPACASAPAASIALQPTAALATTDTAISVAVPSPAIAAASTVAPVPPSSAAPQPAATRFIGGATSGTDRGAAADTRERGQAAAPDDTYADGILCGTDRRKVRTRDPGCRPSLSIGDQCRRDWSPYHRTGNQTPVRRVPAAPGTTLTMLPTAPRFPHSIGAISAAPAKAISQKRRRRWRWTNAPGAIRQAVSRS